MVAAWLEVQGTVGIKQEIRGVGVTLLPPEPYRKDLFDSIKFPPIPIRNPCIPRMRPCKIFIMKDKNELIFKI
jgi:hypothetical protein